MEGKNLILIGNKNRCGNTNWDGGAFVVKYMVFKIGMIKELKMGPISFLLVELAVFTAKLLVFLIFTKSILCLNHIRRTVRSMEGGLWTSHTH